MNMSKNVITLTLIAVLTALSIPALAQHTTISLVLQDGKTSEAIGFATVSLTPQDATKAYKYVLTNSEGKAEFTDVRKGTFKLKAEQMGYKPYETTLKVEGKPINLGMLKMEQDVKVLEAAKVSAVGNPIIVKKDTIEYNAS